MSTVWMLARAELRARWRASIALALLVAVVVATVVTALAGARRTDSSYRRLLRSSRAYDVEVSVIGEVEPRILEEVAALPQVERSGRIAVLLSDVVSGPGAPPARFEWSLTVGTVIDPSLGREWEIARVVEGRHPDIDDPTEAAVSESFLRSRGLSVGDEVSFRSLSLPEVARVFDGERVVSAGPVHTVEIVGVWRLPHDVSFVNVPQGLMYLSPGFYRERADELGQLDMMYVRLHRGAADETAFIEAATKLARRAGDDEGLGFLSQASLVHDVQRALSVQALALWLFGGLIAVAGLLVVGQALARAVVQGSGDNPVLSAMGTSRMQLEGIAVLHGAGVAGLGAIIGGVAGVLASQLMPLGIARPLEPDPGMQIDWVVLGPAVAGVVALMLLRVLPAIRSTSRRAKEVRARVWQGADVVARAGLPPSAVVGVRLALEPGGRGASVPMRVALAGSVIGIAAVAAAFTFGASFDRLLDTPAEYGWNWDVIVGGGENQRLLAAEGRRLVGSADVAELAAIAVGHVTRGSENFVALSFRPIEGSVEPTLLEGRHAASRDEVALGTTTMRREGLTLGDTIELPGTKQACGGEGGCQLPFEVVGRVVVASLDGNPMDEGGIFTADGHARLDGSVGFTDLAVRLSKGTDLREPPPVLGQYRVDWLDAQRPIELQNLSRVRLMPHVLAGLLGFLAVATLTHALVTSVRRRRHDLAVLKTIGFDRGQLARTVAWQASTLIVLALLLALPLGIVGGRWGWLVMNSTLGAGVAPLVPTAAVALGAAATLAIANAVAFVPARSAARTRAAVVLRTE